MNKSVLIFLVFILTFLSCSTKISLREAEVFTTASGWKLPYQLFGPKNKKEGKKPLILFLHGSGERGNDNRKQLVHVVPYLTSDSFQQKHSCFVLAPQCPQEGYWAPVNRKDWSVIKGSNMTESMEGVVELVEFILKTKPVDFERVYVVGLSMGGFGVFDLVSRKPDLFAAGVPICGGSDPDQYESIKKTPLWIFHGEKDSVVPVHKSREIYSILKNEKTDFLYTEYKGQDHGIWELAVRENGLWEWVFSYQK